MLPTRGKEFSIWGWNFHSWLGRILKSVWWLWEGVFCPKHLNDPESPWDPEETLLDPDTHPTPTLDFQVLATRYAFGTQPCSDSQTDRWSLPTLTIFILVFHSKIFRSSLFSNQGQNVVHIFLWCLLTSLTSEVECTISSFYIVYYSWI